MEKTKLVALVDLLLCLGFTAAFAALIAWLCICIGCELGEHYRW